MVNRMSPLVFLACSGACCVGAGLRADVIEYLDKAEWELAAGDYTTIDFTGFADGTKITDQYADLGVLFGDEVIVYNPAFQDDWGLFGIHEPGFAIDIWFGESVTGIAADFLGDVVIELYSGGELVYTSSYFGYYSKFGGVVSAEPFDAARILDPFGGGGGAEIDSLYFGPPIPGASALGLVGVAFVAIVRRRRG